LKEEAGSGMDGTTLLQVLTERHRAGQELPRSLDELAACGVASALVVELGRVCDSSPESEETVVRAFLAVLADALGAPPELMAALSSDVLKQRHHRALRSELQKLAKLLGA
jgi:hypothetical protein